MRPIIHPDQGDGARAERGQELQGGGDGAAQDVLRATGPEGGAAAGDRAGHPVGEPSGHQRAGEYRLGKVGAGWGVGAQGEVG